MKKTLRLGSISLAGAAATLLVLASAALACTVNMGGYVTFSTTPGGPTVTSASTGTSLLSSATGLLASNTNYVIRYVPLANRDDLCHNSPLALPGVFTTDGAGAWSNQSVTMPLVRGTYSMCAATPVANEPALDNSALVSIANWSNHMSFTIT